jgi:glycosyltransferase involved in cell wall biosynthesis
LKAQTHIEVILPLYNEVDHIRPLLKELDETAQALQGRARVTYLFVNDGSKDGSTELLRDLFEKRNDIRVVELIHNFGHGAAIAAGLEHFQGDVALLMDADFQDSPSALPKLLEAWEGGSKTVVVERGSRQEQYKLLFLAFYYLLQRTSTDIPPIKFGTHCLLDKSVVERINQIQERHRYFPGLVSFASNEITPIRLDRGARRSGRSRVGIEGLLRLAITALLSFSNFPVHLVSLLGFFSALAALGSGVIIIGIRLLTDRAIPGWASQLTGTFFSSGVQLLCIGIIGEYVARIYDEVKKRPLYLVNKVLDKKLKETVEAA